MKEKVVIVGAGIAGFTCGINLLQRGYDVTIIEGEKILYLYTYRSL